MSDGSEISVNFSKPVALFPLHAVSLFPQQVLPLHVFEPRYRQLMDRALDGPGQIAMAVIEGEGKLTLDTGQPRLRPAVCLGQIMQHEKLPDGRYAVILQGICRAKIVREMPPVDGRLYREAKLAPIEAEDRDEHEAELSGVRSAIDEMLSDGALSLMQVSEKLLHFVQNDDIPTHVVMELVSFAMVTQPDLKYRLLEQGSVMRRSEMLMTELKSLSSIIRRATQQGSKEWPKGCSWN